MQDYISKNFYCTTYKNRNSQSQQWLGHDLDGNGWISGRDRFPFSSSLSPDRFWGKRNLLSTGCRGFYPGIKVAWSCSWALIPT
jgi:hypothetical protein